MSRQTTNLIANFAGKGSVAILSLAFIPIYIRCLGIEAYGLVGVFSIIQSLTAFLDLGLGTAVNRELARQSLDEGRGQEMRDLVRTLEIIYWGVAAMLGALAWPCAGPIARHWVNAQTLPVETIHASVVLLGVALALQWPVTFYTNGLMGLQRQVLFNALNVSVWVARSAGAAIVVMISTRPVIDFFVWQVAMALVNVVVVGVALWQILPPAARRAKFRRSVLVTVWRFAAGMGVMYLVILLYTQADKIILSKMLSLTAFGYYTLAGQVAGTLSMLYNPIYTVMFPVFSQRVAAGDEEGLRHAYHRSCQLVSVATLPATVVLALFSRDVLLVWSRNETTAESAHAFVTLIIIAGCLSALIYLPYGLQLAHGRTRYILFTYLFSIALLLPAVVLSARRYGAIGAAAAWAAVNVVQVVLAMRFTDKQFLRGSTSRWLVDDVGRPLLAVLAVGLFAKGAITMPASRPMKMAFLVSVMLLSTIAAALATSTTRLFLLRRLGTLSRRASA